MLVCPTCASAVELIPSQSYRTMRIALLIADKLVKTIVDTFMFLLFIKLLNYFI